ncbi:phosphatidylinositol transfer protein alpha isoform-like [Paramacrobiotus metropolitanus]|uniref:phosphatidylinositol transfer protein alpha isoform-like n=1 Tax=Paramacrobiotus metropolitanus TaxID=2943436 RepID=UPI00244604AD|nr:phosphatidylinositol transfer protein alpha isoform-like [Paramacrobiotus metropolitanus]
MIIKEYRIILPISMEEYPIAHSYTTTAVIRQDLALGDDIEISKSEPVTNIRLPDGKRTSGHFVHKVYHLRRQVPKWAKVLAPKELLVLHEKTWNAFPYSRTEFSNPEFLKEKLSLRLDSICAPDRGTSENIHCLTPAELAQREIIYLDIAGEQIPRKEYKAECDPKIYRSTRTGRGPLVGDWQHSVSPVMCCYKLMTMDFKWLGLQDKVEKYAYEAERKVFCQFYRQMFCWIDQWYGLTQADVRAMEEDTCRQSCSRANRPQGLFGSKSAVLLPARAARLVPESKSLSLPLDPSTGF